MDKFLIGKSLLNASFQKSNATKPYLLDPRKKITCGEPDEAVKESVYGQFFSQLHQEFASTDLHVAKGELTNDGEGLVRITRICGKFFRKFGFTRNRVHLLYPEEAVYLTEAGVLQVYDHGLPLSLQQIHNALFDNYIFTCYLAYARLTQLGYILRRIGENKSSISSKSCQQVISLGPIHPMTPINLPSDKEDDTNDNFIIADPSNLISIVKSDGSGLEEVISGRGSDTNFLPPPVVVYNVFDDRNVDASQQWSKKQSSRDPTFILVVIRQEDDYFLTVKSFLVDRMGLSENTKVVIAMVDNGDVSFQCQKAFSIPHLQLP